MKIIVTGATGFIGSAFCNEMLKEGHEVTAVIRPNSLKKYKLKPEVIIVEKPLERLNEIEGHYDLFYHFAWNGSSGAERNDFQVQLTNIEYTAMAIKTAKQCGCSKFIGAGSQAEYGVIRNVCDENTLPDPFMMYGAAKLSTYYMGKVLSEQLGIEFVWPRIYSVYGSGQNEGTLLSYVIKCLQEGKEPELSSCENMWDFMNINDCVQALRLIGQSQDIKGIINISNGNPRILKEFIYEIREVIGSNVNIQFGAKKTDPKRNFWLEPDISKLQALGFKSQITFKEGIKQLIEHKNKEIK